MASLEENYEFWNQRYRWGRSRGEEWSVPWGGAESQWNWSVYPRIRRHLPVHRILEIGPGHGRWTQYLRNYCQELIVVDISERCIEFCQERFGKSGMRYEVNDGKSLSFLSDDSIDFVFSFESLVHTELDSLASYLSDLGTKLSGGGVGFLHHSNLGSYKAYFNSVERIPSSFRSLLQSRGFLDCDNWRAASVTHLNFQHEVTQAGLFVNSQELVPWGGRRLTDCFSTICKNQPQKPPQILENYDFLRRANAIGKISRLYGEGRKWGIQSGSSGS